MAQTPANKMTAEEIRSRVLERLERAIAALDRGWPVAAHEELKRLRAELTAE